MKKRILFYLKNPNDDTIVLRKVERCLSKMGFRVERIESPEIFDKDDVEFIFIPLNERDTGNSKNLAKNGISVIIYENYGENHLHFQHQTRKILSFSGIQRGIYIPGTGYVQGNNFTDITGLKHGDFENGSGESSLYEILSEAKEETLRVGNCKI